MKEPVRPIKTSAVLMEFGNRLSSVYFRDKVFSYLQLLKNDKSTEIFFGPPDLYVGSCLSEHKVGIMAKSRRMWVYRPPKPPVPKVSTNTKVMIQQKADELVEKVLKPKHIQPPPAPDEFQHNYIADIYTKWYRHYFYFCAKYNVPGPNALTPFL